MRECGGLEAGQAAEPAVLGLDSLLLLDPDFVPESPEDDEDDEDDEDVDEVDEEVADSLESLAAAFEPDSLPSAALELPFALATGFRESFR